MRTPKREKTLNELREHVRRVSESNHIQQTYLLRIETLNWMLQEIEDYWSILDSREQVCKDIR